MSCPYAHQQNGAAERKHRHIVEVGRSLLAHCSMPLKFWEDAFLSAVYLINRIPSRVISFETPLERLFHQKPDYTSLRVFGCACWLNLHPYNSHKLDFRSKQCTFLGYPLHKGFKCLDPSTGRVYISRDVTFDESVFPFEKLGANAGRRQQSEISLLPSSLLNPKFPFGGDHFDNQLANSPIPTNSGDENSDLQEILSADNGAAEFPGGAPAHAPNTTCQAQPGTVSPAARSPPGSARPGDQDAVGAGTGGNDGESPTRVMSRAVVPARASAAAESSAPMSTEVRSSAEDSVVARPKTRLQTGIRKEKQYTDGTVRYSYFTQTGEPQNL